MKIEIKSCQECNELQVDRVYTADSWDNLVSWKCGLTGKFISKNLDIWDKEPKIPKWCPKKVE